MSTVLITGAHGFIAHNLAPVLQGAGMRVAGTARAGHPVRGFDAIYAAGLGDSLQPVLNAERVDAVVHAALDAGPDAYRVNVDGTTRWLEEARAAGVPLQILLSTLSAAPDALSDYGRGKYTLEQRFIECDQVVFRMAIVVGDGGMFARLRESSRRFPVVPLLDGGRQPVYVLGIDFLCNVMRDCIAANGKGLRGRGWNLQQPTAYPLRDVITAINRCYGYRRVLLPVPVRPILALLQIIEKLPAPKLPVTSTNVKGLTQAAAQETPSDFARFGYPEEASGWTDRPRRGPRFRMKELNPCYHLPHEAGPHQTSRLTQGDHMNIPKTMKALVKQHAAPGLWLAEAPVPEIGINDVLIRILKTAICGTDVHIWNWDAWAQKTIPVPMHVGHEFVGQVAAIGSNVRDLAIGEIVSGEGHLVCGRCRNCLAGRRHLCKDTKGVGVNRPGAFAEYLSIPVTNVWHADPRIPLDILSIFDPFGNATHTALSFNVLGEDVLITGAGPIGIMATAIAKHAGARYVVTTDVNPYRLDLARKMGATVALNVRERRIADVQRELGMTEGFDVGLEMSGNGEAFKEMLANMCHGAKIALLGIPSADLAIDWNTVIFNMLTIKGIYGREMYETWYLMQAMIRTGLDISPVITHRFHYTEFEQAFAVMASGNSGKVIMDWAEV